LTNQKLQLVNKLKTMGVASTSIKSSTTTSLAEEKTRSIDGLGNHWDYLLKEMSWMVRSSSALASI
jgi:hypothetical protein